ncbi:MAG: hypothetical protein COB76_03695 [Alphaproteobacteria bacterium]|nr:MAG: hypothetical protein COB76_03695 [Alphaproteobacteria bacterium]
MKWLEEIFFSATFGGEALSLAAAQAVMTIVDRDDIPAQLEETGRILMDGLNEIIKDNDASDFLEVVGHPSWSFFLVKDYKNYEGLHLKTYFLQEMFARGILTLGLHNMSAAHSAEDIENTLHAYAEVIPLLKTNADNGTIDRALLTDPLQPLFSVR